MGEPFQITGNHRKVKRTWGSETSQYPEEKKSTEIPKVVASEIGRAQIHIMSQYRRTGWEAWPQRVKASYLKCCDNVVSKSRTGHVKSCLKMGGPSSKAKYSCLTDSEPVP